MKKYHFLYIWVSFCCGQLNAADINWPARIQDAAQYANVACPNVNSGVEAKAFIADCLSDLINQYTVFRCNGMPLIGRDGAPNPKREAAFCKAQHAALDKFLSGGILSLQQAIVEAQKGAVERQLARFADLTI